MCQREGRSAAGIGPLHSPDQPSAWMTYLASDAVDSTAQKITDNGRTMLAGPFDVSDSGRLCIALDPQGTAFGVWQAAEHVGAEIYNESGALVWSEAAVPDPDAARKFYAVVFDYAYQPVEGASPAYTTFHLEGNPLGGIGGLNKQHAWGTAALDGLFHRHRHRRRRGSRHGARRHGAGRANRHPLRPDGSDH
jgi:uncharacterized protein